MFVHLAAFHERLPCIEAVDLAPKSADWRDMPHEAPVPPECVMVRPSRHSSGYLSRGDSATVPPTRITFSCTQQLAEVAERSVRRIHRLMHWPASATASDDAAMAASLLARWNVSFVRSRDELSSPRRSGPPCTPVAPRYTRRHNCLQHVPRRLPGCLFTVAAMSKDLRRPRFTVWTNLSVGFWPQA